VVGPTGSGKSTLIDLLLGLHCPEAGQVLIDETPLTSNSIAAWRAGLGYVPQDIFLLDDTIAANIAFGTVAKNIDLGRVADVARIAQIADFIENELPDGYQSTVGERGVRLSGGQRQRIGLARALYHRPTTLILDEATSALDEKTESVLMQAIESLQGKITLVVIAHRLSTVEKADMILTVDHGNVRMEYRNQEGYKKSLAVSK
jgi:ABC-type multidrug transport system fused ATPase/permease subunit